MAEKPTAAEIEEVARLLAQYRPGARAALRLHLQGKAPWMGALRTVRLQLKEAVADKERGHKIPIKVRDRINTFAVKYGTASRSMDGVEALTVNKTVRFTATEAERIEAAANRQHVSVSEFCRNAAAIAALKEMEQP